jgi:hypothetical protein
MSTRYSSAAGAAVLLIASLCGSSFALAEGDVAAAEVCTAGKSAVIRVGGHPGKSTLLPRREIQVAARCTANTAKSGLMLVSFIDAAGGEALTKGNVARAIDQLGRQAPHTDETLALNNLCVAHTALRQWPDARSACDAAVTAAARNQSVRGRWPGEERRLANRIAAAVYSNRAVMNWLSDNAMAAQGDFARARSMAPKAAFVVRNAELAARLPARVEYASLPVG